MIFIVFFYIIMSTSCIVHTGYFFVNIRFAIWNSDSAFFWLPIRHNLPYTHHPTPTIYTTEK